MPEATLIQGRYALTRELGRGTYARTFLADDRETGQPCVVKELVLPRGASGPVVAAFREETADLARLEHPRVAGLSDCLTEESPAESRIYLVSAYVKGQSLRELVESGKRFTAVEAVRIGMDIAQILQYLHALKPPVRHRDLRPSNVLLSGERKVYLTDLAAVNDVMRHHPGAAPDGGTPVSVTAFMAPEQLKEGVGPASDAYSLGATLLYLLTGRDPTQFERAGGEIRFQSQVHLRPEFVTVLETLLRADPKARYQRPQEIREALEGVLVAGAPRPAGGAGRRIRWLFGLLAAAALALVLLSR